VTSAVKPGLALDSGEFQREADAYLQSRVRVFYAVCFVVASLLNVLGLLLLERVPGYDRSLYFSPERLVHSGSIVICGVIWWLLKKRKFGSRELRLLDALGLYLATGTCLMIYAIVYDYGPTTMPGFIAVFAIARAVIVPCDARTTVFLSLPILAGLVAIQLGYGYVYFAPGLKADPEYFAAIVGWNASLVASAIVVSAVAAHVNFGLRRQAVEARRFGQYKLEEKIGEGSMGEVYKATHAMLRRPTAIKVLRPEITGESTISRFEREVRQAARLSHPNTVLIYDYGRTPDGTFYYAMEYLEGEDLDRVVKRTGPMPPSRVIHILQQACAGLAEAHDKGLVHRDIKAGNLVLCSFAGGQDVVKLVDFGLVKDIAGSSGLTAIGEICGTPETLAPEVLGGEPASPAADLYALGIVGYYLLTGRQPFDAKTASEFIGAHLHSQPIPARERLASVPIDLEAVLLGCLAKDPAGRPPSAVQLAARLAGCSDAGTWTQDLAAAWWNESASG